MDKSLIRKQYEAKLKAYEVETNPLRKEKLKQEGIDLRIQLERPHPQGGCYVCGKQFPVEEAHFPFCSSHCHERWSLLNKYHERTATGAADLDIRRRQARALEIARELRAERDSGRDVL